MKYPWEKSLNYLAPNAWEKLPKGRSVNLPAANKTNAQIGQHRRRLNEKEAKLEKN